MKPKTAEQRRHVMDLLGQSFQLPDHTWRIISVEAADKIFDFINETFPKPTLYDSFAAFSGRHRISEVHHVLDTESDRFATDVDWVTAFYLDLRVNRQLHWYGVSSGYIAFLDRYPMFEIEVPIMSSIRRTGRKAKPVTIELPNVRYGVDPNTGRAIELQHTAVYWEYGQGRYVGNTGYREAIVDLGHERFYMSFDMIKSRTGFTTWM